MKEQIEFTEFLEIEKKLDIRIGEITAAERVPKSDKLLKLTVSFGPNEWVEGSVKTVVTNIGSNFEPETLVGALCPFIVNLKPSKMMGIISEAMIMVGTADTGDLEVLSQSVGVDSLRSGDILL